MQCSNCIYYSKAYLVHSSPKTWAEKHGFRLPKEERTLVNGKGICVEPSTFGPSNVNRPVVVLDMSVCSLFSAKFIKV